MPRNAWQHGRPGLELISAIVLPWGHSLRIVFLQAALLLCLLIPAGAFCQPAPQSNPDINIPFEQWVAAGPRKDLPWKITVSPPRLDFDQRINLYIGVEILGKELARLGEAHEFFVIARLSDEHGHTIEQNWLANKMETNLPKNSSISYRLSFFVVPGEYVLAVVLYDRVTNRYCVHKEGLHVAPIKNDPLPHAFSSLPRAQKIPPASGIDALRNAKLQSRLALPVRSRRPVHFEVLLVLGPWEQGSLKTSSPFTKFGFAVTVLHILSQLRPPDYSYHLTVVDAIRRQVLFEQKAGKELDWNGFQNSIAAINPDLISAQALEGQNQGDMFLRDILLERLREQPARPGSDPLKVFLLLGSPLSFPKNMEHEPIPQKAIDDLLFFQIRFAGYSFFRGVRRGLRGAVGPPVAFNSSLGEDLERTLQPAHPMQFGIIEPRDLREAIARIIAAMETRAGKAAANAPAPM